MATNSPLDSLQAGIERARLEAFAVGAMVIADVVAHRRVTLHHRARDLHSFVGGVVEHLDFQLFARIFHLADALHQPVDNVLLVENRQLNGDPGQLGEVRLWLRNFILAVLVVQVNQPIAVHAIQRQQHQDQEVRNQQRHVESVGMIKALKCGIQKMRSQVVAYAMRFHQQTANQTECAAQECTLREKDCRPVGHAHSRGQGAYPNRLIVPDATAGSCGNLPALSGERGTMRQKPALTRCRREANPAWR